jgi:hypothetical protein
MNKQANRINFCRRMGGFFVIFLAGILGVGGDLNYSCLVHGAKRNNSLWTIFNRVQENMIKGGIKGKAFGENGPRKVTTRAVQSLDRNIKLNQALWVLSGRMAELKSPRFIPPTLPHLPKHYP